MALTARAVVERVFPSEFLQELHKLLWIEPHVNRGMFDPGWSCREHAVITCCLPLAQGVEAQLTHGKVMYVRGPSGSLPPAGLGQALGDLGGHTWLEVGEVGIVDVSP